MIGTVVDICKSFIDFILKNKEIQNERKEKISKVFEEISLILQDTSDKLKQDEYPHGNCVVMEKLSFNLKHQLSGIISDSDLYQLSSALSEASQLEKEFALRKESETIPTIERASGEFKAMSILLKIS